MAKLTETSRPVTALFEVLGQKWVLRIIWELRNGPLTFRELRAQCDEVSPTVLNQRLALLKETLLLESTDEGYKPTALLEELGPVLYALRDWSNTWAETRVAQGHEI